MRTSASLIFGNDYLNLSKHPHVIERARSALETYGSGATASRLVSSTLPLHEELEDRLALDKNYPHALLYSSGYLTSLGTIPHVVDRHDLIFADRLILMRVCWMEYASPVLNYCALNTMISGSPRTTRTP